MNRSTFLHDGLTFSYLDSDGELPVMIALHAHWMEGSTFLPLAEALASEWRLIALDQRGHGYSDHAKTYSRDDYLADLDALLEHLRIEEAALLGNSLGGVNAFQYAARHPERVRALIIEDIGVEISSDMPPVLHWAGVFSSRLELENQIGARLSPYLQDSFREINGGWTLAFEPRDMMLSQASLAGDHWADWVATDCPALVIRGSDSRVTAAEHAAEMVRRRANTQLCTLKGGHVVHHDSLPAFAQSVRTFLRSTLPAPNPNCRS